MSNDTHFTRQPVYSQVLNPNRSLEKTPSICKQTPLFLCVVDNRNFLIARKYSVFKQKDSGLF